MVKKRRKSGSNIVESEFQFRPVLGGFPNNTPDRLPDCASAVGRRGVFPRQVGPPDKRGPAFRAPPEFPKLGENGCPLQPFVRVPCPTVQDTVGPQATQHIQVRHQRANHVDG